MTTAIIIILITATILITKNLDKILEILRGTELKELPYTPNKYLFNIGERNFYEVLKNIVKDEYKIFAKVRLIDLLEITAQGKEYWKYRGKVSQKHIDFILCDPKDYKVKLGIELDGLHHQKIEAREGDEFKNLVMEKIGIPLLRIQAKQSYSPIELKKLITSAILLKRSDQPPPVS